MRSSLQEMPKYPLHLKKQGLTLSFIRVYLAAILAFHPWEDNKFVFLHDMSVRFLKGLELSLIHI